MSKFHKWCLVLSIVVTIFSSGIKCDDDCDDTADDSPNPNDNNNGNSNSTKNDDSKSGGPIGETTKDIIECLGKSINTLIKGVKDGLGLLFQILAEKPLPEALKEIVNYNFDKITNGDANGLMDGVMDFVDNVISSLAK
ncbi:hypothetical protein CDAR_84071 [Caerostris darwini]|uniref:Uncharacterized protein n=1 Tax=Caerostris darwini TaxID=1538125 RepID=A0AAV4U6C4_9ARAC|nr:hypothetical protein CDAR_84071 [Caerostris darwini]